MPNPAKIDKGINVLDPPDLAIEIFSHGQTIKEEIGKLKKAVKGGVRCGWLFVGKKKQVHVVRPGREVEILGEGDILAEESILPGFSIPLAAVFGWLA